MPRAECEDFRAAYQIASEHDTTTVAAFRKVPSD